MTPATHINPALLIGLGIIYAFIFWGAAAWRPWMPLLFILASAPFPNDISGGGGLHFSFCEINLLLSFPVLFLRQRRLLFGPTVWPVLIYIGLCVVISAIKWSDLSVPTGDATTGDFIIYRKNSDVITACMQMVLYLILMVMLFASLPRRLEDYKPVLDGFLVVCLLLACSVLVLHTGKVLGLHKNAVGGSLSMAFLVSLELGMSERRRSRRTRYFLLATVFALGCLGTLSRGSWIASGVGVFVLFSMRRQFGLLLKLGLLLVPLLAVCWMLLPAEQKAYATGFEGERWNIKQRYNSIAIAKWYIKRSPVYGMGVGLRKQYDATNLLLLTLAETGVVGFLAFAFVILSIMWFVWKTQRGLPRDHFAFSVVAICGAVVMGHLAHGMVDHYWGRGGPTVVQWSTLGMTVFVAETVRRHRAALRQQQLQGLAEAPVVTPALPEGVHA